MKITAFALGVFLATPLFAAAPATLPPKSEPAAETNKPVGTKEEQLAAAQKELVVIRLRHPDKHPVVQRQRARIARLQQAVREEAAEKPAPDPAAQLAQAKRELAKLLEKYTDQHPLVIAQKKRVAELERG